MVTAVLTCAATSDTEPRQVARALQERDTERIGRLVNHYHYRLLRFLIYVTGRREQAEDLVQETWIRVMERAGQYDGRSRFEPWLFGVARNLAFDHLRRRDVIGHAEAEFPASDHDSPFVEAARSEDALRIATAMAALEPIYREALLLRFQEELSLQEIAQVAGTPLTTVSSRIYRGLALLRARLEGAADAR